ncbi:MAG: hypothetical protein L6R37_005958 [Teloschistes peruensis]|nr:MAG: hypothetical protein L6R37_005958 [Teloschistes peruensis]
MWRLFWQLVQYSGKDQGSGAAILFIDQETLSDRKVIIAEVRVWYETCDLLIFSAHISGRADNRFDTDLDYYIGRKIDSITNYCRPGVVWKVPGRAIDQLSDSSDGEHRDPLAEFDSLS